MADLASTDVTLTFVVPKDLTRRRRMNVVDIAFGDAAKTYPANGVPMPAIAKFGMFKQVDVMILEPPHGDGYVYKYDRTNHKIRIYQSAGFTPAGTVAAPTFTGSALATHSHDLVFKANAAANAVTMAANSLRNASGGDLTVVGGGADGGIAAITAGTPAGTNSAPAFTGTARAAAALAEMGNVAVAATAIRAVVIGK